MQFGDHGRGSQPLPPRVAWELVGITHQQQDGCSGISEVASTLKDRSPQLSTEAELEACKPSCLSIKVEKVLYILCEARAALPTANVQAPHAGSCVSSGSCPFGAWLLPPALTALSSLGLSFPICQMGTRSTIELLPWQPDNPAPGSRSASCRTRRGRAPVRKSPRSLIWEPPRRAEPGGGKERQSPKWLPAPVPQPIPAGASSPSPAWQKLQPRARHIWGYHCRLWKMDVGSPGTGLWERKGTVAKPT